MAFIKISLVCLIVVFVFGDIPGSESSNFPLADCFTSEMDLLILYFTTNNGLFEDEQLSYHYQLVDLCYNFFDDTATPRVMRAEIFDSFSMHDPDINVSSWYFKTCNFSEKNVMGNLTDVYSTNKTVQQVLEAKIRFLRRLFSEMRDVRENAAHVAVMFLDGVDFSSQDSKNISHVVQQYTDVKIFVVILGVKFSEVTIHMKDTLILPMDIVVNIPTLLIMRLCNQCEEGWFPLKHNNITDSFACYQLFDTFSNTNKGNWLVASKYCNFYGTFLAGIETHEELSFLQTWLKDYFSKLQNKLGNSGNEFSALVYIGLRRDSASIATRFEWLLGNRPLTVNNWLTGKPSGGRNSECGSWQFDWSGHNNISNKEGGFVEGWVDVGCGAELGRFFLCELALELADVDILRINPATNDSFTKTLKRRNVIKYGDNIVSLSVHIASNNNLKFMKESELEFPVFDCEEDAGQPLYISYIFVCDNVDNCRNRRDESSCVSLRLYDRVLLITPPDCNGEYCCDGSCLPLQYINDGEIDCDVCKYSTENIINDETGVVNKYLERNETCAFICEPDTCVHFNQLMEVHQLCSESDRSLYEVVAKLKTADTCYNRLNQSIWAPTCVYVKDRYGAVMGCRDMSHLKDCKDFQCSDGYVKCPNAYCIPQHYVLNGKTDCPKEEDEQGYIIGSCSGNFVCWNSKMCLHPDLVCDGHPECPHGDDEIDCDEECREGFRCISGTVTVTDYNRSVPLRDVSFINSRTRYIDLSGIDLSHTWKTFYFMNASVLLLSHCKFDSVLQIINLLPYKAHKIDISNNFIKEFILYQYENDVLQNLRHLNLSYNKKLVILRNLRLKNLEILDVSHTDLSYLDETFFVELPNMKHLNFSYTLISDLHKTVSDNVYLQTLDLRGLKMLNLYEDLFNGLTVSQHLYTDVTEMCCPQIRGANIPYHTCHAPEGAISSCFDLIEAHVQRALLWLVAVLAVLGNMAVIVYRLIWGRSVLTTGYGLFVTNLGISDFIMGVYLFIIAGADYYYRGIYVLHDKSWRESILCRLAGFLATVSMETSTYFIFLITLDRFLIMKFPFGQTKLTKTSQIICLLSSWIIGFLLALTPTVLSYEIYTSNAMCLGLPLTTERVTGWEYSFGVFIVHNFLMFLIIAYGQIAIFRAMSENRITTSDICTSSHRVEDIMVAKQLSLVVLSNFLCWFPVGLMGLLTLGGHVINNDVYAWTTVIVLPINSAANPILYTIPALVTRWQKFKKGGSRSHRTNT